ncbi:MAG: HNH endonuclease [Oceanospirillaceae bacterium]|nr:HNH endonuclease [Oceanospirillaceae bacterium]
MSVRNKPWTRQQLLVAYYLYTTELTFGQCHAGQPLIIKYSSLIGRTPNALAMKLCNIASLDPAIINSGRKGLTGASAADRSMWQEMQSDWAAFFIEVEAVLAELTASAFPDKESQIRDQPAPDYHAGERQVKTAVRIGQASFRRAVLSAYANRCCITGLSEPRLLVASHIIPWRDDVDNRLNPHNGLALSMLHDKAFDVGLITVDEKRRVVVSAQNWDDKDEFLHRTLVSCHGQLLNQPEKFLPHQKFLEHHREHIFLG